jgi:predicted pyridoxine 5'-phosphate oxidase superfamily flavin-nucleotide-binding protein
MERELLEKARGLINANYISTSLSTVDKDYNVNVAVVSILEMVDDETIICARFGADRTYANLKETAKGVLMVLLTEGQATKDGIRVHVELKQDLTEGAYYERIKTRLAQTKYAGFPLKNCLVFKIVDILPISMLKKK